MTQIEKLTTLKMILGIKNTSEDEVLTTYLSMAEREIIFWRFSHYTEQVGQETTLIELPAEYEPTQIFAVVTGYSQGGAENQTSHNENGISRSFKYEDMIAYIRSHVIPFVSIL